ncbi:MAG: RidA family protein [Alphaproteobacteria bacterium]
MNKVIAPTTVFGPIGHYSHGIEIPPNARFIFVAGQIGTTPDGTIPEGVREQTRLALTNIVAVLEEAGMGLQDVVKLNAYLIHAEDVDAYAEERAKFQGPCKPASTLAIVAALARPEFRVEIEAVAAKI